MKCIHKRAHTHTHTHTHLCTLIHAYLHICAYFRYYYFTPPILPFQSIPTEFFLAFFLFHSGIFLVHCVNVSRQHPGSQQHQHVYFFAQSYNKTNIVSELLCLEHYNKQTYKEEFRICLQFSPQSLILPRTEGSQIQ